MSSTKQFKSCDWYDEPRYYDLLLEDDTEVEADFLEELLARYGNANGRDVLEPACGSGRLVFELARRGYHVMGTDLSQPMLDYARERLTEHGLEAELRQGAMQSFRTRRRFDLAFCLLSSFRYLLTEDDARAHLEGVASALRRGGLYVLGLHLTQYDWEGLQRERWVAERDGTRVVCNLQSWPAEAAERRERLRSRLVVEEQGRCERLETHWDFRTYDARELRELVASVPELEHVVTYDFTYDLTRSRKLHDEQLDCVLVLRRT